MNKNLEKIKFHQYDDLYEMDIVESMWAERNSDNNFIIKNIPSHILLFSENDIVSVKKEEGEYIVDKLIQASGNSTLRIVCNDRILLNKVKQDLLYLKCDSEMAESLGLLAINVPVCVNFKNIIEFIEAFIDNNKHVDIDYEEACISEIHQNQLKLLN